MSSYRAADSMTRTQEAKAGKEEDSASEEVMSNSDEDEILTAPISFQQPTGRGQQGQFREGGYQKRDEEDRTQQAIEVHQQDQAREGADEKDQGMPMEQLSTIGIAKEPPMKVEDKLRLNGEQMATKDRREDKVIPAMSQEVLKNREAVTVKAEDRVIHI